MEWPAGSDIGRCLPGRQIRVESFPAYRILCGLCQQAESASPSQLFRQFCPARKPRATRPPCGVCRDSSPSVNIQQLTMTILTQLIIQFCPIPFSPIQLPLYTLLSVFLFHYSILLFYSNTINHSFIIITITINIISSINLSTYLSIYQSIKRLSYLQP